MRVGRGSEGCWLLDAGKRGARWRGLCWGLLRARLGVRRVGSDLRCGPRPTGGGVVAWHHTSGWVLSTLRSVLPWGRHHLPGASAQSRPGTSMCRSTPPPPGRGLALLLFPFFRSARGGWEEKIMSKSARCQQSQRSSGSRLRRQLHCRSGFSRDRKIRHGAADGPRPPRAAPTRGILRSRAKLRGRRARRVEEPIFSSHPPGAPLKNGEIEAPGDVPAGMCASCTWMCNVRFRHDTDVCRNRRAHARRDGAPERKSEPSLRTPRRALIKPQYSPRKRAPRFPPKTP